MTADRGNSPKRSLTEAERRLWSRLRANRVFRGEFQRDVPVGHYVVDFANPRAKVVVEVDDGQITGRRAAEIRAIYLNAVGYRVVRIWHSDIGRRLDAVLYTISEAVNAATPAPSAANEPKEAPPAPTAKAAKRNVFKKTAKKKKKTAKKKREPRRQFRKKG